MSLSGKTVIVTGATSGIGAACVREFLQCGARIVLVGRDKERADRLLSEIRAKNSEGLIAAQRRFVVSKHYGREAKLRP